MRQQPQLNLVGYFRHVSRADVLCLYYPAALKLNVRSQSHLVDLKDMFRKKDANITCEITCENLLHPTGRHTVDDAKRCIIYYLQSIQII